MYRRHAGGRKGQQWMGGILILAIVLCASVVPGHARRGGGHGFHGGHRGGGHGWRGHGHYGKHSWGGVGVSIGVGSSWWPYGYPYVGSSWWPYSYPYVYPYRTPPRSMSNPHSRWRFNCPHHHLSGTTVTIQRATIPMSSSALVAGER